MQCLSLSPLICHVFDLCVAIRSCSLVKWERKCLWKYYSSIKMFMFCLHEFGSRNECKRLICCLLECESRSEFDWPIVVNMSAEVEMNTFGLCVVIMSVNVGITAFDRGLRCMVRVPFSAFNYPQPSALHNWVVRLRSVADLHSFVFRPVALSGIAGLCTRGSPAEWSKVCFCFCAHDWVRRSVHSLRTEPKARSKWQWWCW